MKTRMMRKIAVLVTGSALALSFPVAGAIAEQGGVPHEGSQGKGKQGKQEKQRTNKGKHKGQQKQNQGLNGNGFVCPDHPTQAQGPKDEKVPEQALFGGLGHKCGLQDVPRPTDSLQ